MGAESESKSLIFSLLSSILHALSLLSEYSWPNVKGVLQGDKFLCVRVVPAKMPDLGYKNSNYPGRAHVKQWFRAGQSGFVSL